MHGNSKVSRGQAISELRKLGYTPVSVELAHGCPYDIVATARGRRKVKIHARSYVASHRYLEGISYRLLGVVDEFIFWFERERWCYVIPSAWLLGISNDPDIVKTSEQWLCHIRVKDDVFEVVGGSHYEIEQFRVHIAAGSAGSASHGTRLLS